jgi:hypothetical protein
MQAKLTALKGQFQLAPNLKKAGGIKEEDKRGDKKKGGGDCKNKNNANKKDQKKDEQWKKTPPKERDAHEKKVKGQIWCWCKHHMVWGNDKVGNFLVGQERINQQNIGQNQVAAQAALAIIIKLNWQALMANTA